ncbi:MAG: acyltransferase [Proteobacteria bacterium]|nr:acyltransferase [Pseudomonadota bacterium]
MEHRPSHRADIDGLRGLAVLLVMAAAFSSRWLTGAALGIDIFFVISGYLVTSIVLGGLEQRTFSPREFYGARLRRVLPALIVVLAAVLILGWFLLFAGEYRELGKQVAAASLFLSNFVLWRGYAAFEDSAPATILLHLWSLAIGAQFVLAWPLLLMLAWRRKTAGAALIGIALVASLAASLYFGRQSPAAGYYSPLLRAWEPLAGALLAWLQHRGWRWHASSTRTASVLGLCLVLLAVFFGRASPGGASIWTLLVVAGTFLILSAPAETWVNRRLLGHWTLALVGAVSFPLFLWHWPLLAFARIAESGPPSLTARLGILLVAAALAVVTTMFVERPLRRSTPLGIKALSLAGVTLAVGAAGFAFYLASGLPGTGYRDTARQDFVGLFEEHDTSATVCEFPNVAPACVLRDPARRHAVMLWGDTHAQQLYDGLQRNLPANWQILRLTSLDCYPSAAERGRGVDERCAAFNAMALDTITNAKPDVVIMAQDRWQFIRIFEANAARLKALGVRRTLFAGPTPHWSAPLPTVIARNLWPTPPRRTMVGVDRQILSLADVLRTHFATSDSMAYVDIMDLFCNRAGCLTYLGDDPRAGLTSGDNSHLTPRASDYLARQLLARMVVGSVGE